MAASLCLRLVRGRAVFPCYGHSPFPYEFAEGKIRPCHFRIDMYHSLMNDRAATLSAEQAPDTTIFSLLHAAHALEDRVEAALEKAGLSTPKFSVLSALVANGGPLSLSELASRLSCVRSNMTQLVDRLELEGLVRRVDDPADRRVVKAAITEAGRAKHAGGAERIDELHRDFAANVDEQDRVAFGRLLSALK